jgi:hypothetical protein
VLGLMALISALMFLLLLRFLRRSLPDI